MANISTVVRVNAYMPEEVYALFQRVKKSADKRLPEPMSESQAVREAIRAWAKQERVR
jgi:hypothetical protein